MLFNKRKQEQKKENGLLKNVADIQSLFAPDVLVEKKDFLYLGPERLTRTFAVALYPRETHIGWLDEIFSIGELELAVNVETIPDSIVINELTKQVSKVMTTYSLYYRTGNILQLPTLEEMIKDLEEERRAIQTNRDRMFYVSIYITLHAKDEKELEEKSLILEEVLARKATKIRALSLRQVDGLKATLLASKNVPQGYYRNITTGGLATMVPITNPDLTHPSGIYLGRNLSTGAPMFLNSFIGPPYLNNQHISIFGVPGSGKSVALKTILGRNAISGVKIAILDPEGEYKKLVRDLLDGDYIQIKQGAPTGINLFEIEPDIDDGGREYVPIMEKVAEIRAVLGAIARNFRGTPLEALEIVAIEQAVRETYRDFGITEDINSLYEEGGKVDDETFVIGKKKKKMPTLSDFHQRLSEKPNAKDLAEILIPFLRGGSMGIFDCQSKIDSKSQVFAIDLSQIKDEFTKFYATFVLLSWLWQSFVQKNRGDRKMVAVDETWMFVKYPESAKFLESLARRGRKHKAALIVASQFIDEFLSSEDGQAVINSCATHILMRQLPAAVEKVVEHFHLASGAYDLLQTFSPGECIISLNNSVTAIKVEPFSYEWPYITT